MARRNIEASRTNRNPWTEPAIVTAIGIPPTYFMGIAMPNSVSVEIPSIKLRVLKRLRK
jgi:hypothetical protein